MPDKPTSWQRSQEAAELGLAADRNNVDDDHDHEHHDVSEHQTFDLARDPDNSDGLDWEKHADENRRKRRRYRLIAVMAGVQVSIIVIALIVWSVTGAPLDCSHPDGLAAAFQLSQTGDEAYCPHSHLPSGESAVQQQTASCSSSWICPLPVTTACIAPTQPSDEGWRDACACP